MAQGKRSDGDGGTRGGTTEAGATKAAATEAGATEAGATEAGAVEAGATEAASSERRAVLTTGANSGIGLAAVVELARRGYHSIGSVRSEAKVAHVQAAATAAGVDVETVLLDVTDAEQCERVVADVGPLYGLVNNAGYSVTGAIEDVGDDEARHLLETMLVAPMRLARLALPGMRAAGRGRIVNVSSVAGRTTAPFMGWYTAAKHALEAASDALRLEVAAAGVHVSLVEPGSFKTGIWEDAERDIERREQAGSRFGPGYRRSLQAIRMGEPLMGDPRTVAGTIAASLDARTPRARYLIGIDAQLLTLVDRMTPTSVKDRVTRLVLGL